MEAAPGLEEALASVQWRGERQAGKLVQLRGPGRKPASADGSERALEMNALPTLEPQKSRGEGFPGTPVR